MVHLQLYAPRIISNHLPDERGPIRQIGKERSKLFLVSIGELPQHFRFDLVSRHRSFQQVAQRGNLNLHEQGEQLQVTDSLF